MSKHAPKDTRTERISLAVTPSEKRMVAVVAMMEETDVSNLLRTASLNAIVAEFHKWEDARRGAA